MTKNTQRNTHRDNGNQRSNAARKGGEAATVQTAASAAEALPAPTGATIVNIADGSPKAVQSIFAIHAQSQVARVQERQELVEAVKQDLEEAKRLSMAGAAEQSKAEDTSAKAGFRLYQGRIKELLSADNVSDILKETWGPKMKKDGTPSKTPDGLGEVIRKRVVRAVGLVEFLEKGTGGSFFEGMPEDAAKEIREKLDNGGLTINSAYAALAEAKSGNQVRIDPAFNPAAIAKMIQKLSEPTAASVIARSPGLIDAYTALLRTLNMVGAEAAAIAAKAAKAMPKGAVAA